MVKTFKIKEHEVQIDDIDVDLMSRKWYITSMGGKAPYVKGHAPRAKGARPTLTLHRVILERMLGRKLERWEHVDHIDRNPLNNKRGNLRLATSAQNAANRAVQSNNKLGVKGVRKHGSGYEANVCANGKSVYLGIFPTIELAHAAYLEAAKKLHGEFARGE